MGEETTNQQVPVATVPKRRNIWLFVILILIVIAIVVYLILQKYKSSDSKTSLENSISSTNSSGQSIEQSPKQIPQIDVSKLSFDNPDAEATLSSGMKHGPYQHQIFAATSTDGINFVATGQKIADHASVPDLIKLPSGQLVFYAVDGIVGRSNSGALMGVSNDNGQTWTLGSVQVDGDRGLADPQIILEDDSRLRIYYKAITREINSAISTDGVHFVKESGVRFAKTGLSFTDPDLIKIGNTWFMYLTAGGEFYATSESPNGVFEYGSEYAKDGGVSKTVKQGDLYRQFYCENGISSRTSTDGIRWGDATVSMTYKDKGIVCDPSPAEIATNSWLMLYKYSSGND